MSSGVSGAGTVLCTVQVPGGRPGTWGAGGASPGAGRGGGRGGRGGGGVSW